jgi:WD40 repeat protein
MSRDALVVGINTYQWLPGLQAPAQDAEAIAKQLQTYGEFRVHRLPETIQAGQPQIGVKTKVTLRELETALVNLFKPKGSNIPQTALFYFSGHGIQKEAGIQEGFLAVSDSQPDVGFYGLSLFWLRRLLQESPVRQRIILLDCCHSGELLNFLEADPGARPGTDRLFMAASREYEPAYESLDSSYSVFTKALLKGLDPNREVSGIVNSHSLTACVSHSLTGEIQQPLFESSGSEIILTRCLRASQPPKVTSAADICPYRGLEFFDEVHAEYFFGREDLTDQLIDRLRTGQFVAVVGASGSGKSSLIRAGLIWQLRQGRKFSGSDRWRVKLITPTEHPIHSLAAAFIDPELTELERAEQLRRAETFLQDGGTGLAQLVRATLSAEWSTNSGFQTQPRPSLLLVIDQFEEVFTLCQGPQVERERLQFFNCLVEALKYAEDYLRIVVVLRADFFGKCSLYEALAQQIQQNLVTVTPLNYEQIKATILRPAEKVGLLCEPNLVYTMLLDVIGAPGELPLLQYTLLELWQRRQSSDEGVSRLTLDAYTDLGGVRGALQKRATEIFHSLTIEEQAVAKRIFLALTQLGEGTEDTRRRIFKSELVSPAFSIELIEQTLEKLVASKLVITNQEKVFAGVRTVTHPEQQNPIRHESRPILLTLASKLTHSRWQIQAIAPKVNLKFQVPVYSTPCTPVDVWQSQETIDVAHEALIRNWSLLRTWLDQNREMLQRQRRIARAAREWDGMGQPLGAEYLLRGGRLLDAEDFLQTYPHELPALARRYITVSREESRRAKQESRLVQIAVPSVLLMALGMTFSQYHAAIQTQAEKDYQLRLATSRERAAIAQSILQQPNDNPMAALLVSRLAAEQSEPTDEVQASLRTALHDLRLQVELRSHQGAVHQLAFSTNQGYMATAGADGTIRLWPLEPQTIYTTPITPKRVLHWQPDESSSIADQSIHQSDHRPANLIALALSPTGEKIAAIAQGSPQVKIWSAQTGQLALTLSRSQPIQQVMFSADGRWIVTISADREVTLWQASTGRLQAVLPIAEGIRKLQLSPDGRFLLVARADGNALLWQLPATFNPSPLKLVKSLPHGAVLNDAVFSSSGRWIATAGQDGRVRLWDTSTGQLHQIFATDQQLVITPDSSKQTRLPPRVVSLPGVEFQPVIQILFSPDEQYLAVVDASQRVWLWGVHSNQVTKLLSLDSAPTNQATQKKTIAFSPDSQLLLTTEQQTERLDGEYAVHLWETQTGQEVGTLQAHQGDIEAMQFSPDGTYAVTAGADGVVRLWAAEQGGELPTLSIEAMQFSPDGTYAVTAGADGVVRLWAAEQGGELPTLSVADSPIRWATFVTPRKSLVVPSFPQPIASQPVSQSAEPGLMPGAIATLMTATPDGSLQRWTIKSTPTLNSANSDQPAPPYGRLVKFDYFWQGMVSQIYQTFQNFRDAKGLPPPPLENVVAPQTTLGPLRERIHLSPQTSLSSVAVSQTGELIALATTDGWIEIRQQTNQSSKVIRRLQNLPIGQKASPLEHLTFSPDQQRLLGVSGDMAVRLWDVTTGQLIQILRGHQAAIEDAQFSADGRQIVTASQDKTVRVWRTDSGRLIQTLTYPDAVSSAQFNLNGEKIAAALWNGKISIADVETGEQKLVLSGHQGKVLAARYSPDGRFLVTAGMDGTARIWDTQSGIERAELRPTVAPKSPVPIRQVFFSPDGAYVTGLADDGQVYLWVAAWDKLLKLAHDRSFRQLTSKECDHYLHLAPGQCPQLELPELHHDSN